MPKVPIDYTKTIIYKLVHKDDLYDENIYTGHTTDMRHRKNSHKTKCTNPDSDKYHLKVYQYIRENGGWDTWLMIEIEKYPCKDVHEARARERVIQTEMKAKLNSDIAGRTRKEWVKDNCDKLSEYTKQYNIDNREKIAEQRKQYHIDNRMMICEKTRNYNKHNKDKIAEKKKQRHEANKDVINEKRRNEKATCDHCGSIVRRDGIPEHMKTLKCINFKPA